VPILEGLVSAFERYMIRGGIEGRERLRVLARAMAPSTATLLDRVVVERSTCLDVGCGGGDVTLELARRAGPNGRVVGVDLDESQLGIARDEAVAVGAATVSYVCRDVLAEPLPAEHDLVYARFLVTHLPDRPAAVAHLADAVVPGGALVLEDIDFAGSFCFPPSTAYDSYCEIYARTAEVRGGDANVGRQLPALLLAAGCERITANVVQPCGLQPSGYELDVKLIAALTMENIGESAISEGIATRPAVESVVAELYRLADDPETLLGLPRIVQAVGYRPADSSPDEGAST
jgi:2-polyprenyl-3-methyl-5-hydroxy-6-metoxy-1,4-benzoquinol methylase